MTLSELAPRAGKRRPRRDSIHAIPECGVAHNPFAKCKDGVQRTTGARQPRSLPHETASSAAPDSPPQTIITEDPALAQLRAELAAERAKNAAEEQRRALEKADLVAVQVEGRPLSRPAHLRSPSQQAKDTILGMVDMLDGVRAGRPPTAMEVAMTHDSVAAARHAREDRPTRPPTAAPASHMNGELQWTCQNVMCKKRFSGPTIEVCRRRARAEPGWQLACPFCSGVRVIAELAA